MTTITGQCLCGQARYSISEPPIAARICWCKLCQKIGAGSATVNVAFPSAAATIEGALGDFVSTAESGNIMHRRFCPTCGVHMFSAAESRPHLIFVRAGTLDDPSIVKPSGTIWTAEAPEWACFNPDLPQFPGQSPPVA
jgi:hypothetical protein